MKRILSIVLAVVMVALMIPVTVSATQNPNAVYAASITADGQKDAAYTGAYLPIGTEGDSLYGKAYFAHNGVNLYVYVEVHDETQATKFADKKGSVSGTGGVSFANLNFNDGVVFAYNFGSAAETNAFACPLPANDSVKPANAGCYCRQRDNNFGSFYGRQPFAPAGSNWSASSGKPLLNGATGTTKSYSIDAENYGVEFVVPFGVQVDGTPVDVDALIANGFGVCVQITDSLIEDTAADGSVAPSGDKIASGGFTNMNLAGWGSQVYPAGVNGFVKLTLDEIPLRYQTADAAHAFSAITVDGVKDDIYDLCTNPIVINGTDSNNGEPIKASTYFAYDNENLYIFSVVEDKSENLNPVKDTGNVTPAGNSDSMFYCFNVMNKETGNMVTYNETAAVGNASHQGCGVYGAFRGGHSNQAMQGRFAFVNMGKWSAQSVSTADGYTLELKIPFPKDDSGNAFAELVAGGNISILTILNNTTKPATSADGQKADDGNGAVAESFRSNSLSGTGISTTYNFNDDKANCWDRVSLVDVDPDSIEVTTNPTKVSYNVGDTFESAGMVVKATYYTGETYEATVEIPLSDVTLTYGSDTAISTAFTVGGSTTITATYGGKTDSFDVTVLNATVNSLTIQTPPTKTAYIEGQSFDPAGMVVIANITDPEHPTGHDVDVTTNVTYAPLTTAALATTDTKVTVSYSGKSVDQTISVAAKTIVDVTIDTLPTSTTLRFADAFTVAGMTVKVNYDNGTSADAANCKYTIDGVEILPGDNIGTFFNNVPGTHTVTVTYNDGTTDYTDTYEISVSEQKYQVVKAHEVAEALAIDGVKDSAYMLTSPMTIKGTNQEDGEEISANIWFAYDSTYIYAYGEVIDTTKHENNVASTGNITPLCRNDALVIDLNVDKNQKTGPECSIYTSGSYSNIKEWNDASGVFGVFRGNTTASPVSRSGGLAYGDVLVAGAKYTVSTKETDNGYVVEYAIPWMQSKTVGQNFFEMAKTDGVAMLGTIVNGLADNPTGAAQYIFSEKLGKNDFRDTIYPFTNEGEYTWDKLEFVSLNPDKIIDTSKAATAYDVGDLFTSDGVAIEMSWADGKSLSVEDFEIRSDIYLTRAFASAGHYEIQVISGGEYVGSYWVTVDGSTPDTGDMTSALIPFAVATAVLALAGIVILTKKKSRA